MFRLNNVRNKVLFIMTLCMLGIGQTFAAVSNCRPPAGDHFDVFINFDITNNTTAITPGTTLGSQNSGILGLRCEFTGSGNNVYFRSNMPENIRNMLIGNGVEIFQQLTIGANPEHNITQPGYSDIYVGTWDQPNVGLEIGVGLRYTFTVKKGAGDLKPFDTGVFLLGHHINEERQNIGMPIYARFVGNLTLLCPTPKVDITSSNGGSVNFGTISPQNMRVNPECETGLNISVRFEPNNNTILDNKNLDLGNGLQVLLKNSSGDVEYDESYSVGDLMPFTPVDQPYTATLSHIPGRDIVSGPFTKTIRVVVSY